MVTAQEAMKQLQEHLDLVKAQIPEGWIATSTLKACVNPECRLPILGINFTCIDGTTAYLYVAHSDKGTGVFQNFDAPFQSFKIEILPQVFTALSTSLDGHAFKAYQIGNGLTVFKKS